ncbi:ATP-binding protein [Enterovirga sp. CN4-39]|uniref:ATP-binding protein n=1 Tax=Enterovirga sp. CN4-39 TaxID=3400910 RepID=UPI003C03884B
MPWTGARDRGRAAIGAAIAAVCIFAVLLARAEFSVWVLLAGLVAVALAWLWPSASSREDRREGKPPATPPLLPSASVFPDPVILVDRRLVVTGANEAARAILPGLKERQPLAFALRSPEILDAIPAVAASGEPARVEVPGRSGHEQTWEVRIRRLASGGATTLGEPAVALFFRDLTDHRRLETMRVDFIANVSHELRTPLASLSGFIDTLKGPARDDPKARERFLDIMQVQAQRMTRLIDDLLQLSRVELKEHVPPTSLVDLGQTVAHMVEVMAPLARERGVELALDLPAEPILILGDRDELLRLVENLVENAIKYGGPGKAVEIVVGRSSAAGSEGERVELSVRDHGPGIPPEHLPRLTERFYRVDVAESRTQGGTGLGLAIVKHIVGRHRGRLAIESTPGQGATFRALFPPAP